MPLKKWYHSNLNTKVQYKSILLVSRLLLLFCRFLLKRTEEVVGRHYKLKYPFVDEFKTARGVRTSAIYSELLARGAVFGERMGWERPLYFMPHHGREDPPEKLPSLSFGKPEFFEDIEDEYLVCREGVGLIGTKFKTDSKYLYKKFS